MVRVGWIFSLVRSGSSAAAYGCAAPWNLGVADEPFGPWDRTGPPYDMPPVQRELARAFAAMGHTLTAEVVGMANDLFRQMAERDDVGTGRVVCKCPHLMFTPDDFETWFGGESGEITHRAAYLIRNPLRRANSAYARGWDRLLNDPFELEVYRTFMRRWKRAEHRFKYDDLRASPETFFRAMHKAFAFSGSNESAAEAAAYLSTHYHASSAQRADEDPSRPLSERAWDAPREVLDVYFSDEEIVAFMREQGWPTRRGAYAGSALGMFLRRALSA